MTENKPYVKKFDGNGKLLNPINRVYLTTGPNRRERRWRDIRFLSNRKSANIQVVKTKKFKKVLQRYYKADGTIGLVKHYL